MREGLLVKARRGGPVPFDALAATCALLPFALFRAGVWLGAH